MKQFLLFTTLALMTLSCQQQVAENPLLIPPKTPFGVPAFDQIKNEHYLPAFEQAIKEHQAEVDAIVNLTEAPTFDNTVAALDYSGRKLQSISMIFFSLLDANGNDTLQEIAQTLTPMLSEHGDNVSLNPQLFNRIKTLYEDNDAVAALLPEQKKLLVDKYKSFVRSGALLDENKKNRLREINKELDLASLNFSNNVMKETNDYALQIDKEEDLSGLPQGVIAAAADEAKARGQEGKWIFTLQKPSLIPFLQYADNRDLREKLYKAYLQRGDNNNEQDNKKNINTIVNLAIERAQLLGFNSPAEFILDNTMAKTPDRVMNLLNTVWSATLPKVKAEAVELQKVINAEGKTFKLASWDWWYYTQKLRKAKFDLDEEELRPYFKMENVLQGVFTVANRLWGVSFTELPHMPLYNPDMKCFEMKDADGSHLAIFYIDYFPTAGKRPGAWMSNFKEQYVLNGKDHRPVVFNVGNFTKPQGETPSLLNLDEVETLFHEFGHATHGMMTKCTYPGQSGTSVARDMVELPSQIMEHWATHPEVLRMYARHYQTGECIPDELIEKMQKSKSFNSGFTTTEFVAAAILDMNWYINSEVKERDVRSFEAEAMKAVNLIEEIEPRYRSSYFMHIFGGGYAAGYYSYLWAEVLDADAFEAFVERGDIFNQEVATAYRENILEKGGSVEPMELYVRFRGHEPTPDAMLKNRGLK